MSSHQPDEAGMMIYFFFLAPSGKFLASFKGLKLLVIDEILKLAVSQDKCTSGNLIPYGWHYI